MARQNDHVRAKDLISAYLDKRMTAEEKNFFERHIASCSDCRAELESTRAMVAALRAMPLVKAPRSFVLPREMARPPRRSILPLYPALRLATVIAALAFVILFASDVLVNQLSGANGSQRIPAGASAPAVLQAPAAPRAAAPTEAPAATSSASAADSAQAPSVTVGAPAAGAAAKAALSNTATLTETTAMSIPSATPEVSLQAQMAPETTPQAEAPQAEAATMVAEAQARSAGEQSNAANLPAPTSGVEPVRIIEIALLVLAAGFGIAALAVRRKQT